MMAIVADFYPLPTNTGRVYVGWAGTSAIAGNEIGVPLLAGDVATFENPIKDANGNPEPFDLYDLFLSGTVDGAGVTFLTW
jgi:hypothetical protein